MNGLSALIRFKKAEGHCNVHAKYKIDGFRLGTWVSTQRTNHNNLSPERRKRLVDIGFAWDSFSDAWEMGFAKLEAFVDREGHCRIEQGHVEDSFKLGVWVRTQRKSETKLSPERRARLEAIGFV